MLINSTLTLISPSPPPLLHFTTNKATFNNHFITPATSFNTRGNRGRLCVPQTVIRVSSSDETTVAIPSSTPTTTKISGDDEDVVIESAEEVVRKFYEGINGHDLASVGDLIANNCVYEDLIFASPFVGRKEIMQFFRKFIDSTARDLQFVIDDLSTEDSSAVGVTWHLEWKKRPFPFSKGCSFYRLEVVNKKRQIVYGRDSVEPAIKPGEAALVAIRGVTWLLQQFPQLADRL
uniref:SnoaL-like domain-containing protein n=1 Tax=Fagus sylvatica TaxID=28930 RepID=A0A2N9J2K1_FAGSY